MVGNYFYKDRSGGQNGPVSFDELTALAKAGRIAPNCLVWGEGGEPKPAGKIPGLAEIVGGGGSFAAPTGQGPLIGDVPGWGLIWRSYVLIFGVMSIVFAPLAGRWFYRFLTGCAALPNGRRMFLNSPLSSCWWLFLALAALIWGPVALLLAYAGHLGSLHDPVAFKALNSQLLPFRVAIQVAILVVSYFLVRWFVRSLRSEDGSLHIVFTGGFWAFIGWDLLIGLSLLTIIGWAWAVKGKMDWMCRRIEGSHHFQFVASGWDILWRTFAVIAGLWLSIAVVALAIWLSGGREHNPAAAVLTLLGIVAFIYLLGLALRWFANWYVSQIVATPCATSAEDAA